MLEEIKVTSCGFSAQSRPLTAYYERSEPTLQSLGERTCDKILYSRLGCDMGIKCIKEHDMCLQKSTRGLLSKDQM